MKKWLLIPWMGVVLAQAGGSGDKKFEEMARINDLVGKRRTGLACVTPQPVYMNSYTSFLCRGQTPAELAQDEPHAGRFITVYVTTEARQILLEGKGEYPVGTLIVKEKCRDATGKDTELFTAMIKRAPGYNPTVGDWEFMVLDSKAKVTASGKIDSCMECHQRFALTGYVSRAYLQKMTVSR